MKNLSRRIKILLGVTIGLLVVVVFGVVFTQTGAGVLSGAAGFAITPLRPTVVKTRSVAVSVNAPPLSTCKWTSSNTGIATVASTTPGNAQVTGVEGGEATITVKCGIGLTAKTTVTVIPLRRLSIQVPAWGYQYWMATIDGDVVSGGAPISNGDFDCYPRVDQSQGAFLCVLQLPHGADVRIVIYGPPADGQEHSGYLSCPGVQYPLYVNSTTHWTADPCQFTLESDAHVYVSGQ